MDLNSIRNRYALLSILGGCLVLLAAGLTNFLLNHTRQTTAQNIVTRQHLLSRSSEIRNTVWHVREAIGHFLIDPERTQNRDLIHQTIAEAMAATQATLGSNDKLTVKQYETLRNISDQLSKLDRASEELIRTRMNPDSQYPGLTLARAEMLPRQQQILGLLTNAIHESSELVHGDQQAQHIHQLLVEVRHEWSLTISAVRMLIASRVGSFGLDSVPTQLADIELYLKTVDQQLAELNQYQRHEVMALGTEAAIDEVQKIIPEWKTGYQQLLQVQASSEWRSDIRLLRQDIDPIMEKLWTGLMQFDSALTQNADTDVQVITQIAQRQSYITWSIAAFGVIFIVIGFIALDRYLLTPISQLTRALFREAHGEKATITPRANTTETRNLLAAFNTMRELVHQRQNALEYQAMHDDLTDLPNRSLLYEKLNSILSRHTRKDDQHTLIIMDLDRFKEVNDTLGHQTGDELLIAVSVRLRYLLRDNDLIARLGGDEFAILLAHANDGEARNVARKIIKAFEAPFQINQHELYVGASLGLSSYPYHGMDAETLIKRADTAMYVAKRNRMGYAFYESIEDRNNEYTLTLASDLRNAVRDETLEIYYQLKYDLEMHMAVGCEALLRWHHPQHGNVSPTQLIPIAEQLGLINRITLWVLEKAIRQCRQWRDEGIYLSVAVNLSVYDLQSSEIVRHIQQLLEEYDVPPSYLVIEITEGAMLIEPEHAIDILNKLDAMGVRIAIDDYGSGYSSLGYLKQLPVDELKIDKSFVMDMISDDNDAVIVRSTIDLAHNLGLQVVAEGVENVDIYQLLEILDCDTAQGFYMCRPMPAEQISQYLYVNVRQIYKKNRRQGR